MDRSEVSRRLKAARALRGVKVTELAKHELLQRSRITANLIGETERQERDAREMELRVIADALELPPGFLLADDPFAHATDDGIAQRLDRIESQLVSGDRLEEALRQIQAMQEEILERADRNLERGYEQRSEAYGRILDRLEMTSKRLDAIEDLLRRDGLSDLHEATVSLVAAQAQLTRELEELRGRDRRGESGGDGP